MVNDFPSPDADLDPSATVQGHNCQQQVFSLKRSLLLRDPRNNRVCREFLMEDQFGNFYLVYRAILQDGETYDVSDWVKPSILAKYGGFTDACLDDFRAKAFMVLDKTRDEIAKYRALASEIAGKLIEMPVNIGDN